MNRRQRDKTNQINSQTNQQKKSQQTLPNQQNPKNFQTQTST